jgi:hypothetical protein
MDILNFISWIKAGKYSPTMPTDAITVVGVPNPTRGDAYLPVTVPVTAFASLIPPFPVSNTNIGKLLGGGIVVAEWDENGVKKALIASLTTLGDIELVPNPLCLNTIFGAALSYSDGFTNTNELILATGAPATTAYAAGLARLHNGGGYNDWYLPAIWELNMCYNAAAIVNKVLGSTNGFPIDSPAYWSSTQAVTGAAWKILFFDGLRQTAGKCINYRVRAVRIHNL